MANITSTQKKTPIHKHVASDITDLNSVLGNYQDKLIAGDNIQIAADGKTISATDTTYTAGTGIDITNGVISNTNDAAAWGNITGNIADQTDLKNALDAKQDSLTAGDNVQIAEVGGVLTISATDTTYNVLSSSDLDTGTSTVSKVVTAKVIADYVKSKISSTYNVKGSKDTYEELPASGNVKGDVWNIVAEFVVDGKTYPAGTNVVWTGSEWDPLGGTVDLSVFYTKTNINTMSGLNDAIAGFSAVDITVNSTSKIASATDHTDDQSINGAQDKNVAAIKAIMNAYNALVTRVDAAEDKYTKAEINTMTGLNAASAGFKGVDVAVDASTKQATATEANSQSISGALNKDAAAVSAIVDAYNDLESRVDSLEAGDDEKTMFFSVNFSGTSHTYSHEFFKADSFVEYNFASDPAGYITFEVSAGKVKIESSATESDLVIKLEVTNNPGQFVALTADA